MLEKIKSRYRRWLLVLAIVTGAIPLVLTAYELLSTEKESVVFLEGYSATLGLFILLYYVLLIVLAAVWVLRQLLSLVKAKKELKKAELMHLKSQVNPHFFFNMLNNLYGMVEVDVERAQQLILKLSDMMRYSIYQGQADAVTIQEEIEYIQNFIELHKMRYLKKVEVDFTYIIEEEQCQVMPLLFIILVENAFKHGVENLIEDAKVEIKLVAKKDAIEFTIRNNFNPALQKEKNGIGLENLKRRLELVYNKKHALKFRVNADHYEVQLNLQLHD